MRNLKAWERDIADTLRYRRPHERLRPYLQEFMDVIDYGIDHVEYEGDEFGLHAHEVLSTPVERLVVRAKDCDLDEARAWLVKHQPHTFNESGKCVKCGHAGPGMSRSRCFEGRIR